MHRIIAAAVVITGSAVAFKFAKEAKDFMVMDAGNIAIRRQRKTHEEILRSAEKLKSMSPSELTSVLRNEALVPRQNDNTMHAYNDPSDFTMGEDAPGPHRTW